MATPLLQDQNNISKQQPMPTDDMSTSSSVQTVSGETVSLYYSNSGTRTLDAGQAAGTAVMGQLANKNILDANGGYIGTKLDTSISFTGDCFDTEVAFPETPYKDHKDKSWAGKLTAVTENFANGEYCVDYRSGTVYGVKTTTTASLTSTSYKINQAQSGASGGVSSSIQGTQDHDEVATDLPLQMAVRGYDVGSLPSDVSANGDVVRASGSRKGELYLYNSRLGAGEDLTNDVAGVVQKPLAVSTYAYSVDQSAALEASSVIKASAGTLYKITGRIDSTASTDLYYLQIINAASVPANGSVTLLMAPILIDHTNGTNSFFDIDLAPYGVHGSTGLVLVASTTEFTKTIITSNWMSATALYK